MNKKEVIIIYRSRETNKITSVQKTAFEADEPENEIENRIAEYNANETYKCTAEARFCDPDSLEAYLFARREASAKDLKDELNDLCCEVRDAYNVISDLVDRLDQEEKQRGGK